MDNAPLNTTPELFELIASKVEARAAESANRLLAELKRRHADALALASNLREALALAEQPPPPGSGDYYGERRAHLDTQRKLIEVEARNTEQAANAAAFNRALTSATLERDEAQRELSTAQAAVDTFRELAGEPFTDQPPPTFANAMAMFRTYRDAFAELAELKRNGATLDAERVAADAPDELTRLRDQVDAFCQLVAKPDQPTPRPNVALQALRHQGAVVIQQRKDFDEVNDALKEVVAELAELKTSLRTSGELADVEEAMAESKAMAVGGDVEVALAELADWRSVAACYAQSSPKGLQELVEELSGTIGGQKRIAEALGGALFTRAQVEAATIRENAVIAVGPDEVVAVADLLALYEDDQLQPREDLLAECKAWRECAETLEAETPADLKASLRTVQMMALRATQKNADLLERLGGPLSPRITLDPPRYDAIDFHAPKAAERVLVESSAPPIDPAAALAGQTPLAELGRDLVESIREATAQFERQPLTPSTFEHVRQAVKTHVHRVAHAYVAPAHMPTVVVSSNPAAIRDGRIRVDFTNGGDTWHWFKRAAGLVGWPS